MKYQTYIWGLVYTLPLILLSLYCLGLAVVLCGLGLIGREIGMLPLVGVAMWLTQRTLINPYASLLRAAAASPSTRMCASDAYWIIEMSKVLVGRMHEISHDRELRLDKWGDRLLIRGFLRAWTAFAQRLSIEERQMQREAPETLPAVRSIWKDVFANVQSDDLGRVFKKAVLRDADMARAAQAAIEFRRLRLNGCINEACIGEPGADLRAAESAPQPLPRRYAHAVIRKCDRCDIRVLPTATGECPSCGQRVDGGLA